MSNKFNAIKESFMKVIEMLEAKNISLNKHVDNRELLLQHLQDAIKLDRKLYGAVSERTAAFMDVLNFQIKANKICIEQAQVPSPHELELIVDELMKDLAPHYQQLEETLRDLLSLTDTATEKLRYTILYGSISEETSKIMDVLNRNLQIIDDKICEKPKAITAVTETADRELGLRNLQNAIKLDRRLYGTVSEITAAFMDVLNFQIKDNKIRTEQAPLPYINLVLDELMKDLAPHYQQLEKNLQDLLSLTDTATEKLRDMILEGVGVKENYSTSEHPNNMLIQVKLQDAINLDLNLYGSISQKTAAVVDDLNYQIINNRLCEKGNGEKGRIGLEKNTSHAADFPHTGDKSSKAEGKSVISKLNQNKAKLEVQKDPVTTEKNDLVRNDLVR